ncbi:MAG: tetratricopeptide repeat protein [Bacteroidetes bacterium]|nr:tetratricopeptide repeat protein [Bacteroidota bacterium]
MRALVSAWAVALASIRAAGAQSALDLVAQADALRAQGQFAQALSVLERAHQLEPRSAEVLWRLARAKVDWGERVSERATQRKLYLEALEHARKAVSADGRSADAHKYVAIAAGRVGLISDTRTKIEMSRQVKESAERALALNPNDDDLHHILGRWHHEVAGLGFMARAIVRIVYGGLPEASYEKAVEHLERALRIRDAIRHRVELAKSLLELGRKQEARAVLERALQMPPVDVKDSEYRAEARELLKKAS